MMNPDESIAHALSGTVTMTLKYETTPSGEYFIKITTKSMTSNGEKQELSILLNQQEAIEISSTLSNAAIYLESGGVIH